MTWRTVYDLRHDQLLVEQFQDASLNRPGFGFKPEPDLFASANWWRAIDDGNLAVHTLDGTIARSYMAGHGDFPQFDFQSDDGKTSTWERRGDEDGYREGARARVSYVIQHLKDDVALLPGQDRAVETVIKVDVEDPY